MEFAKIRIKSYNILLSTIPKEAQNLTKPDISSPQKSPYPPVPPLKSELIEIMEKQYVTIFKAQNPENGLKEQNTPHLFVKGRKPLRFARKLCILWALNLN